MRDVQSGPPFEELVRRAPPAASIDATRILGPLTTDGRPVLKVECEDGRVYAAKFHHGDRSAVNDQVVTRLGWAIGAPVPEPALVRLDDELLPAGVDAHVAHATIFVEDLGSPWRAAPKHRTDANVERLDQLEVLRGLVEANDLQLFYEQRQPHKVWSIDHDSYFPECRDWHARDLVSDRSAGGVDWRLLSRAQAVAAHLTPEFIAQVVAAPPDEWGIELEDRVALAGYIWRRRERLL